MSFRNFFSLLSGLFLAGVAGAQTLPLLELTAGIHRVEAEVVNTQQMRMTGLMNRRAMAPQRGMLFVFDEARLHCMWMKNTYIPLSVAFLDDAGRIINVEDMQPHSEENHCAAKPARYALEMNVGWFRQRHLGAGTPIANIERAPRAR
ncbi:MAG: DUF192 domain-containing protein [Gammaproteobacteria bacterium]|nr:DUF192 domain-containing protein [Gammaproteobacteria bacterium]MBU1646312.1 DUF192 domain-containing protein [Gammaproteobacteria bacterium]MBU1970855.1 DUF192 domain-containing protein [Gammaproteobacteria bacterium]